MELAIWILVLLGAGAYMVYSEGWRAGLLRISIPVGFGILYIAFVSFGDSAGKWYFLIFLGLIGLAIFFRRFWLKRSSEDKAG